MNVKIIAQGGEGSGKGRYARKLFEALKDKLNAELIYKENYFSLVAYLIKNRRKIDFVHSYDERFGYISLLLRIPTIVTVHDIAPLILLNHKNKLFKHIYKKLHKAKRIITSSYSTETKLTNYFPRLRGKTQTIHLGVDPKRFKPSNNRGKRLKIGFLGNITPIMREQIKDILINFPNVEFEFGGYSKKYEYEELTKFPNFKYLGFIKEEKLASFYNTKDIFIYNSEIEGFGLIPLEAMASGCALISSNVDSLPEVIKRGGMLINNHEFLKATTILIENNELRKKLQKQGVRRANELTWERFKEKIKEIYDET